MMLYIAYSGIVFWGEGGLEKSGIWKKLLGQLHAFQKAFGEAYGTMLCGQTAYLMDGGKIVEKEIAITRQDYYRVLVHWIEKYQVTRTYVRYPFADFSLADKWFIELLSYQKMNGIRTVLEIPTYPYDKDFSYGRTTVEDAYFRTKIADFVDMLATYSTDKVIWGIPCICLVNGIEAQNFKVQKKEAHEHNLVLLGINSGMGPTSGYERAIEGLRIYYEHPGSYEIKLKLAGKGGVTNQLKQLASDYGLLEQVEFCGFLEGEALERVYLQSDIGLNGLGGYKRNNENTSSLRAAEYCARGLPIICGSTDARFPSHLPFILSFPNDSTPIDMNLVIRFYEELSEQEEYRERIHNYAVRNLSWDHIMRPVISYLQ